MSNVVEQERQYGLVIEPSKLLSLVANIGDTRKLIIHPWSTPHEQLDRALRGTVGL